MDPDRTSPWHADRLYMCFQIMLRNHTWPLPQLFNAMFCLHYHCKRTLEPGCGFFPLIAENFRDSPGQSSAEHLRVFARLLGQRFPMYVSTECTTGVGIIGIFIYGLPFALSRMLKGEVIEYGEALNYATSAHVSTLWLLEIDRDTRKVSILVLLIVMVIQSSVKKKSRWYDVAVRTLDAISGLREDTSELREDTSGSINNEHLDFMTILAERMSTYKPALSYVKDLAGADIDFEDPFILAWNHKLKSLRVM